MTVQDRFTYILDLLQKNRTVSTTKLAKELEVSHETIRRDLETLEKEGRLIRIHGGASIIQYDSIEYPFNARLTKNAPSKEEIAKIALNYVSDGQSIALDYSTTCSVLAKELKNNFSNLTIITNSLEVINIFADSPSHNVIFLGGIFNHTERGLFGTHTNQALSNLNIDIAFLSFGGVSIREGFTESFYEGAELLREMMKSAQQKIALLDSTKFDKVMLISVCPISNVDMIITDSNIKDEVLEKYRTSIEVISRHCLSDSKEV